MLCIFYVFLHLFHPYLRILYPYFTPIRHMVLLWPWAPEARKLVFLGKNLSRKKSLFFQVHFFYIMCVCVCVLHKLCIFVDMLRSSGLSQNSPRPSQRCPRASQGSPSTSQGLDLPPEPPGGISGGSFTSKMLSSTAPAHKNKPLGILLRIQLILRKWWQQLLLGPHLPHAPGARMTVV